MHQGMTVAFQTGQYEYTIPIPEGTALRLREQIARLTAEHEQRAFAETLIRHLCGLLDRVLDPDLLPPTEKQVAFAFRLANRRGIQIPPDALIYRDAMFDFLDKYKQF